MSEFAGGGPIGDGPGDLTVYNHGGCEFVLYPDDLALLRERHELLEQQGRHDDDDDDGGRRGGGA